MPVIQDVIALVVPEHITGEVPLEQLERLAHQAVARQYVGRTVAITFMEITWLVTSDADEAERFQPAHDCAACRAGADQARAYLRENPERRIALGNITYREVWPDGGPD